MNTIKKISSRRGCGYRKPGGMYLVSDGFGRTCGKLPFALTVCHCCGSGIKQTRGFTWINSDLFAHDRCDYPAHDLCGACPMTMLNTRCGLLWVGEKYYPSVLDFEKEAAIHGISKRIAQIPRDLELGKTWLMLAHPRAVAREDQPGYLPGIFRAFIPSAIEYILTGQETPEQLEALEHRGVTLVEEIRDIDLQQNLNL